MASPTHDETHGAAEPVPGEYGRNEEAQVHLTPTPTSESRDNQQEAPSPIAPIDHEEPGKLEEDQTAVQAGQGDRPEEAHTKDAEVAPTLAATESAEGEQQGEAATAPLAAATAPSKKPEPAAQHGAAEVAAKGAEPVDDQATPGASSAARGEREVQKLRKEFNQNKDKAKAEDVRGRSRERRQKPSQSPSNPPSQAPQVCLTFNKAADRLQSLALRPNLKPCSATAGIALASTTRTTPPRRPLLPEPSAHSRRTQEPRARLQPRRDSSNSSSRWGLKTIYKAADKLRSLASRPHHLRRSCATAGSALASTS